MGNAGTSFYIPQIFEATIYEPVFTLMFMSSRWSAFLLLFLREKK